MKKTIKIIILSFISLIVGICILYYFAVYRVVPTILDEAPINETVFGKKIEFLDSYSQCESKLCKINNYLSGNVNIYYDKIVDLQDQRYYNYAGEAISGYNKSFSNSNSGMIDILDSAIRSNITGINLALIELNQLLPRTDNDHINYSPKLYRNYLNSIEITDIHLHQVQAITLNISTYSLRIGNEKDAVNYLLFAKRLADIQFQYSTTPEGMVLGKDMYERLYGVIDSYIGNYSFSKASFDNIVNISNNDLVKTNFSNVLGFAYWRSKAKLDDIFEKYKRDGKVNFQDGSIDWKDTYNLLFQIYMKVYSDYQTGTYDDLDYNLIGKLYLQSNYLRNDFWESMQYNHDKVSSIWNYNALGYHSLRLVLLPESSFIGLYNYPFLSRSSLLEKIDEVK